METLLTVREVAQLLGVSMDNIYRLKDKPDGLRAYRVGNRCLRFRPSEVEAYLEARRVKPVVKAERPSIRRFQYVPGMKVV